jgi:hypothetical protein
MWGLVDEMEAGKMVDRQVAIGTVIAYGLWIVATLIWVGAVFLGSPDAILGLAVIVSIAASTATIRCYFAQQSERVKTALAVIQTIPSVSPVRTIR